MKTILTGIKPSGTVHLGNYLGMIRPAIEMANAGAHKSFLFIADYHALTTVKNAQELREHTKELACTWLACGLDPKKTMFYKQSDVPKTFELATILSNVTTKGLLDRAHAFKDAQAKGLDVNMGTYNYPVLMAADIILMDTNLVPVGQDQKQHVEMTADIARSFNALFGDTLIVPKEIIKKEIAVIPGLDGRKMSKSYGNIIPLFCDETELLKCIKRITTDSSAPTDEKPADHLIFQLYKHFAGVIPDMRIGWGVAKQKLFEVINSAIKPMREKYLYYMNNFDEVEKILEQGAKKARAVAKQTLARVRDAVGV